jgi:hypothetical protein
VSAVINKACVLHYVIVRIVVMLLFVYCWRLLRIDSHTYVGTALMTSGNCRYCGCSEFQPKVSAQHTQALKRCSKLLKFPESAASLTDNRRLARPHYVLCNYITKYVTMCRRFQSMRILSLGSFIIMRLTAYRFVAFKRDMPCKAFCKEVRHDVEGLRFVPDEARARLESEADNEAIAFGGA